LEIPVPGTEPEKVLAQVARTYGSKGLSITSTAEGEAQVQGQEADTLDIPYDFNGVFAERKLGPPGATQQVLRDSGL
jgi:hypothetical protein